MRTTLVLAAAGVVSLFAFFAVGLGGQTPVRPGHPLPGITAAEFSEFRLGLDDFTEVETPEEGLGPAFNGASCAVCHSVPAIGGGGVIVETPRGLPGPGRDIPRTERCRRHADPPFLNPDPRLPADDSRRCDGDRAASADPALRCGACRGHSGRGTAGSRRSLRRKRRRCQRAGLDRRRRRLR